MTAPRVSVTPDATWFRASLRIPSGRLPSDFWDELAALFAEDPEKVTAALLGLHELNEQVEADVHRGDDHSADDRAGQANAAREVVAGLLPVDVAVGLDETEVRVLAEESLAAARHTFSARIGAGHDPERKASPLRSIA